MKKHIAFILALTLTLSLASVSVAAEGKIVNAKCPASGEAVDPEQTVTYTKAVGFCCGNCLGKFQKDPTAHAAKVAKVPAGKIGNSKCPMSGEPVDETAVFALAGSKVAFCCNNCLGKFKDDPAKHMAKVKFDKAANEECIFSGDAIDATKVAMFTAKIGFCCGNCKGKFEKDPDSLLSKVEFTK